ncbi:signal transduction histidine kinase [Saccharothrix tamanrassetensis]|uniref:histidine kinase n=1 Tax=Saccharothrix tamanrassetensis TaxID=1051531 RepID=A0A841CP44_9PSEU|nr:histidine kinase [Saccharothrix tamanrassetensis]MBB5958134.1 signal transduction histidine kinase [Saccharothrix tamanrassetensis]
MNALVERVRSGVAWLTRPSGPPPPRPTRRNLAFDVVLAVVLGVVAIQFAVSGVDVPAPRAGLVPLVPGFPRLPDGALLPDKVLLPEGNPSTPATTFGAVLLAIAASAALAFRRRYPLAVLWAMVPATLLAPHDSPRLTFYACVIAVYSAAAYSPYRLPTAVGVVAAVLSVGRFSDSPLAVVPNDYIPLMLMVPIAVAANGLRTWKIRTDERTARVSALEREQAEALRRAVEDERARIARELHDVMTHNVSVMVIQAGAARKVMAADPGQAQEALLAVEAGGRAAMSELRHVMGLLAADGDHADLTPQPGLGQLEGLVAGVRDTGVPVELSVRGTPRPLPSGVQLAAYRVVQEALTNTVKHAAGATAEVVVEYGPDSLRVEVADTGGASSPSAVGNGRGLIGLRERLGVYRGTLRTGPRAAGGYRVVAEIPLEAS